MIIDRLTAESRRPVDQWAAIQNGAEIQRRREASFMSLIRSMEMAEAIRLVAEAAVESKGRVWASSQLRDMASSLGRDEARLALEPHVGEAK
jgi:hypothetical protein